MSSMKPLIYLVEDDADVVDVLLDVLRDNYNAVGFGGSKELFEALKSSEKPDLFLLDINLPFKSGIEILEQLREHGFNQPVILVSGYGSRGELVKSMNLGVTAFIDKPIDFKELSGAVTRLITSTLLTKNREHQLVCHRKKDRQTDSNLVLEIQRLEREETELSHTLQSLAHYHNHPVIS